MRSDPACTGVNGQEPVCWIPALPTLVLAFGYFTVQPNQARVLIFSGRYTGNTAGSLYH